LFFQGKLEENHSMSSPGNDSALATDVEVAQKIKTGKNADI
jgi:hypothetical protein